MATVRKDLVPTRVVGITGSKGHGKDTFANLVLSSAAGGSKFKIYHFADSLKLMAAQIFDMDLKLFNDQLEKEKFFEAPINMDLYLGSMNKISGLEILPKGLLALNPRQLLQYMGTDYIRSVSNNYWVDKTSKEISRGKRSIIPDVRFPNEVKAIRDLGGFIIKIERIDLPKSKDLHSSETSILDSDIDMVIGVRTGDTSILERAAGILALVNRLDYLKVFDYRNILKALQAYQLGESIEKCNAFLGVKSNTSTKLNFFLKYYGIPFRKPGSVSNPHIFNEFGEAKICGKCLKWLGLDSFNKSIRSYDGLHSICRGCSSSWHQENYLKFSESKDLNHLYKNIENQARLRGKDFSISLKDLKDLWLKQDGKCYYSHRGLTFTSKDPNKISLDRLDSSRGYYPDNIVFCTVQVNLMKKNYEIENFKEIIKSLAANLDKW